MQKILRDFESHKKGGKEEKKEEKFRSLAMKRIKISLSYV